MRVVSLNSSREYIIQYYQPLDILWYQTGGGEQTTVTEWIHEWLSFLWDARLDTVVGCQIHGVHYLLDDDIIQIERFQRGFVPLAALIDAIRRQVSSSANCVSGARGAPTREGVYRTMHDLVGDDTFPSELLAEVVAA